MKLEDSHYQIKYLSYLSVSFWCKDRQMDQCSAERIRDHIFSHLCYDKGATAIQWINIIFSINDVRLVGYLFGKKIPHTIHKNLFAMNHRHNFKL